MGWTIFLIIVTINIADIAVPIIIVSIIIIIIIMGMIIISPPAKEDDLGLTRWRRA